MRKPAPAVRDDRLDTGAPAQQPRTALFFISSRTGMTVKRPAMARKASCSITTTAPAIDTHLHAVGDRLLSAFGDASALRRLQRQPGGLRLRLDARFARSNFAHAAVTTSRPYLPALVGDIGPDTAAIRHDWGQTLTELANEHFLQPMHAWARDHHTLLRVADLRLSAGHALQQSLRGPARRRRQSHHEHVARILGHALGRLGRTPVRSATSSRRKPGRGCTRPPFAPRRST